MEFLKLFLKLKIVHLITLFPHLILAHKINKMKFHQTLNERLFHTQPDNLFNIDVVVYHDWLEMRQETSPSHPIRSNQDSCNLYRDITLLPTIHSLTRNPWALFFPALPELHSVAVGVVITSHHFGVKLEHQQRLYGSQLGAQSVDIISLGSV